MARSIQIDANSFTGKSGSTYIIYPSLSVKRFEIFERMQVELEHNTTLTAFKSELSAAYGLFNQMKFADGSAKLNNLLNAVERITNNQPHPILMMCSLFICTPDEDQSRWTEAEAQEKIEDWADIDIAFFLACARLLAGRFTRNYDSDSPTYSLHKSEVDQEAKSSN